MPTADEWHVLRGRIVAATRQTSTPILPLRGNTDDFPNKPSEVDGENREIISLHAGFSPEAFLCPHSCQRRDMTREWGQGNSLNCISE